MDLLDEESHRLLLWIVRLGEVGATPTEKELYQLAQPRQLVGGSVVDGLTGQAVSFNEAAADSLVRRGLVIADEDECLEATDLGRQVVSAMDFHPGNSPLFEVLEADLRSADVLGFARIAGRIATLHRPMIVDPYCDRDQLEYLVAHTTTTRVLISDRLTDNELEGLAQFVDSIADRRYRLRLRVASSQWIHDRHVISEDRVFQVSNLHHHHNVGSTVLTEPLDLSYAIRDYYDSVWDRSAKLAPFKPSKKASVQGVRVRDVDLVNLKANAKAKSKPAADTKSKKKTQKSKSKKK